MTGGPNTVVGAQECVPGGRHGTGSDLQNDRSTPTLADRHSSHHIRAQMNMLPLAGFIHYGTAARISGLVRKIIVICICDGNRDRPGLVIQKSNGEAE